MTLDAIKTMSDALSGYIVALGRAPTSGELTAFITTFIRARKNGSLMAR